MGTPQQDDEGDKNTHFYFKVLQVGVVATMLWLLLLRACVYVDSITPAMQPIQNNSHTYHH
jgi:hypothetical protein